MTPGLVSPWHIAILVVVLVMLFGPKRLPEIGRSLGKGMREFRDSVSGLDAAAQDETGSPGEPIAAGHPREHDTA